MSRLSRRTLLQRMGGIGAATAIASSALRGKPPEWSVAPPELGGVVSLDGKWQFKLDPKGVGESEGWHLAKAPSEGWSDATVPGTWQVSPEAAGYQGVAWYRRTFEVPASWAAKLVRIEFEAVTHSATVWLNDKLLGKHLRKGYTAFSFDISSALRPDGPNHLVVKVDNSFDQDMLPRGKSYDWTVDGGIIRPVRLLVDPQTLIERVEINCQPDLQSDRAELSVRVFLRNASSKPAEVSIGYEILEDDTSQIVLREPKAKTVRLDPGAIETASLPAVTFSKPRLWHFDHPHLYRVVVQIEQGGKVVHSYVDAFGVRKLEVKDGGFYLNGQRVRLMGVERMAGSHPSYGMAEPSSWITHDHDDLKELNCVFTRVHWQQDRRVLGYCDRHGILIQEEVPAWGPETFAGMQAETAPEIMENGLEQLREMIGRDRNHPSIFAWGLCNEVNGQNPPAQVFIKRMAEEARKLDPGRLLAYASNTLQQTPERDAAGLLDFISWNEYYESWYGGDPAAVRRNLEEIQRAFPGKPVVVSEYGYCECAPDRLGGDARRIEILRDHTSVYREFDCVAGAIFFCYNDYRTHIGDKGLGVLKQRVHGVVDLYGDRKPSFEALRLESSPVEELRLGAEGGTLKATLRTRKTLPAYSLEGYSLRWIVYGFGDLPMEQHEVTLPHLAPGQAAVVALELQEKSPKRVRADIVRPTGFSALTAWWQP